MGVEERGLFSFHESPRTCCPAFSFLIMRCPMLQGTTGPLLFRSDALSVIQYDACPFVMHASGPVPLSLVQEDRSGPYIVSFFTTTLRPLILCAP